MRAFLIHPILAVLIPFGVVLLFQSRMTDFPYYKYYQDSKTTIIFFIIIPYVLTFVISRFFILLSPKRTYYPQIGDTKNTNILKLFFILSILEISLFGGLPMLNVLFGLPSGYERFGLPTLHGFVNMLFFLITIEQFIYKQHTPNFKLRAFIFIWPILVVSRGMLMIVILFYLIGKLHNKKFNITRIIITYLVIFIGMFFLFGFIGEYRTRDFNLVSAMGLLEGTNIFILWLYVYIVSPIANLQNTIDTTTIEPLYSLQNTLDPLVPSVIKGLLEFDKSFGHSSGAVVHSFLNASTGFMAPYLDYGVNGIIALNMFYGVLAALIYSRRTYRDGGLLTMFNILMILNIFNINFFALTFLILLIYLAIKERRWMANDYSAY